MITEFPLSKLDNFSKELHELLEKYHYQLTSITLNYGKRIVIIDNSLHPSKAVGYLNPGSEHLVNHIGIKSS